MTDNKKIIRGSFGGGSKPSPPPQPTKTPDTLHSKQFVTFLDLISEGEIEGSASASKAGITDKTSEAYANAFKKDVFLNDTPILREKASNTLPVTTDFNFPDFQFGTQDTGNLKFRFGTANQTKIPGIESSSSTTPVGVEVTEATPVTRQITNTDVDRVKVTITFPQIQVATDKGDLLGDTVEFKISVQYNSGGFTDVHTDTVTGRTADAYQKEFSVKLSGSFPVDIRVTRITADSTDASTVNSFQWTSFSEIIDDASTYANSAYNAIRLDSEQFSSIPSRKFRIRGIKVRIPGAGASSSGTPTVDSETGRIVYPSGYIFNGVMGAAVYTNCPAMVLLDLLTNTRYGFGDHITDSNLDLFSFVTASKFANTLVDDGFGSQEARFSCNVNIQSSSEAFDLINELAGVMRCMPIFTAGSITITQDSPKSASYLFNLSNITSEGFNYSGSSLKQRHTSVSVSYFNMDSQDVDFEVVDDTTAQSKFGIITKQVKAFACTSRGQAARLGRAILFAEQNESELVSFTTSIDAGAIVRPGAIIDIADPVRAGVRRGGRLSAVASTTVMTIDDANASDLATTNSPKFSVVLPDGTVETKDVSSISSAGVVTVSSAFSQTPNVNTVWLLANTTVEAQKFRVITVEEQDGINYSITALSYVESKYDFIEDGSSLPTRTISVLNEIKPPPSNLSAVETIVPINNQAVSKIVLSFQPIVGVINYQVNYRYNNGNFVSTKVSSPDFEILNSQLGVYEFKVFSYNIEGQLSATSNNLTFNAVGKTALPEDPTGLTIEPVSDLFIRLRFDPATDIDVTHGGSISVRHTPSVDPSVATFSNSTEIIPKLSGNISETLVPALSGTYSIKFLDDGGRRSNNAARIIVTQPDPQPNQIILTEREDTDSPPFQGNKVNTFYEADFDGLLLDGTLLFDDITQNIDDLSNIDFAGPIASSGSYEFQNVVEMGGIFNLTLKRRFVTSGLLPNDLIDSRTANIDTWTEFDGTLAEDVGAKLLVATTQLDTTTSTAATYEQSGTTITITKSGHGYSVGDQVVIDFTAGSATDGNYEIQTITGSTFTVTASSSATISSGTSCTYGANFTQFNTFANGEYTARGFKFKCELESNDPAQNINVTELGYEASVKRRTETVNSAIASQCATNSAAKTVTFANPFFAGTGSLGGSTTAFLPTIGITLEGAVSGDYFKITSITGTQFVIETRDSSNNFKDLSFKYTAIGFGKGG